MSEPILLQEKQPQRFEGRNIRTPKRSGATNDIYLVQFEITREAWESLESIPKSALLEGIIWFHYGDPELVEEKPKKEKKPPKLHGEYGRYWQAMYKHGALNHPGLREALKIPDDQNGEAVVKEHLRAQFAVDSLTFIAPSLFEAFCDDGNHPVDLTSLITISRQAVAEALAQA